MFGVQGRSAALALVGTFFICVQDTQAAPCTRLPLSDVAFGQAAATDAARVKLREYALEVAKTRGWDTSRGLRETNETVSCEVYLNLGPIGTEYRCLVTTTFCVK